MNNNDTIEFECTMAVRVWRCVECGFITPECDASCQCQREQWDEGIAVFPVQQQQMQSRICRSKIPADLLKEMDARDAKPNDEPSHP
jgi:hypothetical protein